MRCSFVSTIALLLAMAVLLCVSAAFAQKDKMSLGESFRATILRPAPVQQPAPKIMLPAESLPLTETMTPVKRPAMPRPLVEKAP